MILTQFDDDSQEFVMAYINQSNNKIEAKYNLYEVEHFIIVWVVSSLQCYFCGSPFTLVIDH
jgi:hypothetical protein